MKTVKLSPDHVMIIISLSLSVSLGLYGFLPDTTTTSASQLCFFKRRNLLLPLKGTTGLGAGAEFPRKLKIPRQHNPTDKILLNSFIKAYLTYHKSPHF